MSGGSHSHADCVFDFMVGLDKVMYSGESSAFNANGGGDSAANKVVYKGHPVYFFGNLLP